MGKYATVVFDRARSVGEGLGKALSRFHEGVEYTYGKPGPKIEVTPFAPGSVTTPAVLAKLASSVFAAAREKANYAEEQRYQGARVSEIEGRLNEPKYDYTTPAGETFRGLSASERRLYRHEYEGQEGEKLSVATPPDILAAAKRAGDTVSERMTSTEMRSLRYAYGLKDPNAEGAKFDVLNEAERVSEAASREAVSAAMRQAVSDLMEGK